MREPREKKHFLLNSYIYKIRNLLVKANKKIETSFVVLEKRTLIHLCSTSSCSYLLRVLAANNLCHRVEGVCVRERLGTHAESHHDLLPPPSHPGHHLSILDSDAGSGDVWHPRLVVLPTGVWTRKQTRV